MRARLLVLSLAFAAVAATAQAAAQAPRPTLTVKASSFGRILFDGRGHVLYGFTRDPRGKSLCSGACARAWPPFVVKSSPHAGAGIAAARLGTTRRADGSRQVTYAG